jgi:hypothetical protein
VTARESNNEIGSTFGQHARIAKRTGPAYAAKRSPFCREHLRRDTARLRPFDGKRVGAAGTAGNDNRKAIFAVKAIELGK